MTKEELDIQKEIEEYFTESTGLGRDKIRNFMDIVNKALKQKGEHIEELEKDKAYAEEQLDEQIQATLKLQKENAELKEKLKPENCLKLLAKEGYVKFTSDNLTKATELLKKIEKIVYNGENGIKRLSKIVDVLAEAEQFLKEIEK